MYCAHRVIESSPPHKTKYRPPSSPKRTARRFKSFLVHGPTARAWGRARYRYTLKRRVLQGSCRSRADRCIVRHVLTQQPAVRIRNPDLWARMPRAVLQRARSSVVSGSHARKQVPPAMINGRQTSSSLYHIRVRKQKETLLEGYSVDSDDE